MTWEVWLDSKMALFPILGAVLVLFRKKFLM
jgi:hypothetical protein